MSYISLIVFAVVLASIFSPIVAEEPTLASCGYSNGTYEVNQYYITEQGKRVDGPKFSLQVEGNSECMIKGKLNDKSFEAPGTVNHEKQALMQANIEGKGFYYTVFIPFKGTLWPEAYSTTIDGKVALDVHYSNVSGYWMDYKAAQKTDFIYLYGNRTSGVPPAGGTTSPFDVELSVERAEDSNGQDDVSHPLAFVITLTENGKPISNAKLKVHAFNLPDNDKKLAEYFLVSNCTNCNEGHTIIDGKTISMLCPYEVGLNLPCPLKEQKSPLEITTDANGQARMEFFLPLGRSDAILPSRNSPVTIPINVEYWKAGSDGKEIKVSEKKYEAKLSGIAVVQEILYLAPQDFDGNGNKLMRSSGLLSNWAGDDGVKDGDITLKGADRVKVNKAGMIGPNPEGRTAGTALEKGELLSIGDEITINAGGMVSGIRGTINPLAEPTIPVGAPGNILTAIRFFDGAVGAVQVDGEVPKHVVKIGETPSSSGFKTMPEKLLGLTADFAMDKVNPISQIKSGIKNAIKSLVPDSGFFFFIMKVKSKGESLGILDTVGKPVYIRVQSAIVTRYDNSSQLLVTTREGQATIYTEATDKEGFAVPAGKTAVVNETLLPILKDTDAETGQEADDLLAVLEDPIGTSPVFSGAGNASGGTSSGTNGTAPGSGASGVPGSGNATAGNATSGAIAPGSATPPSVFGPGASAGGTASPVNNNQIGDAAEVGIGQTITQTINPAGSSNFYKFYVNSSGILKFKLENPPQDMKADMNLHDKNFGSIAYKAAANPGDTVSLDKDILGPGWFYLEVRDQAGKAYSDPYSLKISFKSAPDQFEPNPNLYRATEVKSGQTANAYICPVNDEDYYKIYVNTSGILKLKLDAVPKDMKSEISIRDKAAGQIAYATASNPGDKVSLEKDLQGPGWFFIEVRNPEGKAHSDPYSLKIAFEAAPDQYEPNPNFFRATQATSGQSISAYICPVNDEDYYKFYVASQAIAKIKLESVPEDMKGELSIYDKAAGQIAYSTASNPGDKVNLEKDLKGPGWFFLKVRDVNGKAHSQPYTMTAAF
jgi:hypothetical protein